MTENRSYNYIQGEGQDPGHLGHMTPRWTCHVVVDGGFLKVENFRK